MAEDTTLHTEGERTCIINFRGLFQPGEEAHKYRLKISTFTSIEDVEQFISEFNETWDITQWSPRVALAKLRRALTGEAKQYGHRPSVDGIFVALQDRFGITALDARSHLQRLLRKEDTSLQDHALAVKRLARIAYSDRKKQWQVRQEDSSEPPLYQVGDWVWMVNYRRHRGQAAKLQPKFVGPYAVVEVMPNHTYKLERSGQVSVQSEARLKPYWASPGAAGEAPRCWSPGGRQQCAGGGGVAWSMKWSCRR